MIAGQGTRNDGSLSFQAKPLLTGSISVQHQGISLSRDETKQERRTSDKKELLTVRIGHNRTA